MSRRTFLIGGLSTAAVLSTGTYAWLRRRGYAVDPGPAPGGPGRPPVADLPGRPFDKAAVAVLAVLVDQVFPGAPEIGLPSGRQAGAVDFLDRACRHRGLRPVRTDVLKLCRDLNLRARRRAAKPYPALEPAARDALLAQVAADTGRTGRYQPQRALHTAIRIMLEGYLGHPRHGGNRGAAVWTALDIPMPRAAMGHHR